MKYVSMVSIKTYETIKIDSEFIFTMISKILTDYGRSSETFTNFTSTIG